MYIIFLYQENNLIIRFEDVLDWAFILEKRQRNFLSSPGKYVTVALSITELNEKSRTINLYQNYSQNYGHRRKFLDFLISKERCVHAKSHSGWYKYKIENLKIDAHHSASQKRISLYSKISV